MTLPTGEEELKEGLKALLERVGAKGHLLIYIDQDNEVQLVGRAPMKMLMSMAPALIGKWLKT